MLTRRSIVAAGILAPVAAWGQSSPSKMIRIINPFPAGGASDAIARLLQPGLQDRLGATIVVENRPGASTSIGASAVAKSPPDGSTWLLTSDTFVVSSLLMSNLPYDVQKDFEPVTMVARGAMVLCASPSRPYRTLADLVAAAKAQPNTLGYATTGIGSNGHLTVAALGQLTGMQLVHVPYRGVAPALNDTVAGHVDMIVSSTASLAPQIEAGQLRPLVQCGDKRAAFLPDTPTAIESGIIELPCLFLVRLLRPRRNAEADHRSVLPRGRRHGARRGDHQDLDQQVPGRGAAAHTRGPAHDDRRGAAVLGGHYPRQQHKGWKLAATAL